MTTSFNQDLGKSYNVQLLNTTELEQALPEFTPLVNKYIGGQELSESEYKEKLDHIRPKDIGQASRISGIKPSDISILLIYLGR
mgnify:CR=1 FL=1